MSAEHHDDFKVQTEEDILPGGTVLIVAIITLVVFTAAGGVAWWLMVRFEKEEFPVGRPRVEKVLAPRDIHGVLQTQIRVDRFAGDLRERQLRQLENYGWVDRERGLVHIPIEQAMERIIAGEQP